MSSREDLEESKGVGRPMIDEEVSLSESMQVDSAGQKQDSSSHKQSSAEKMGDSSSSGLVVDSNDPNI